MRTLHHYDAIGLLKPTKVTEAGYRMYDDTALSRLQNILLFRELQYKHIGELIILAREIQCKGVTTMNFEVFDKSEIEHYKAEAKAKWGKTQAYQDYTQKSAAQSEDEQKEIANQLLGKFSELGSLRHLPPATKDVQRKISVLQKFITDNYYVCTNEILNGLGQMYVSDERFKKTIDRAGGDGTAEFVHQAISVYCSH